MKNAIILIVLLASLFSCKKAIQAKQEDLVIKAMTDGQWRITKFVKGPADITPDFATYKFQFFANNTVQAINNNSIESTGSWNADATSRTIASNFSTANNTVTLLNGTWQITDNSWTFVEATQMVNGEVRMLRLDK
ncbi:MAG: hypothetical protein M3Y85_07125 [Bacteroidota bacterium]|nr:hypothetical protein [Bacteroidota bacterium]